jgi:cell wall-associated NlpC family hydrolase
VFHYRSGRPARRAAHRRAVPRVALILLIALGALALPGRHATAAPAPADGPLPAAALAPISAASAGPERTFFPQSGHSLGGELRRYWQQYGGLAQFGYPLTEPFQEVSATDGKVYTVQYFERARFEEHPEYAGTPYSVLLGQLGRAFHAADPPVPNDDPTRRYFPASGHSLGPVFGHYWETHGGLFVSGYPITEPIEERSPTDGKTYTVQYFERARYEYHPEHKGTDFEVLLGLLGAQLVAARTAPPAAPPESAAPAAPAAPATPTVAPVSAPAGAPIATAYVTGTPDFLRVRAAPTATAGLVDYLLAGRSVGVLGADRAGWVPVAGPSGRGWVPSQNLVAQASAPASATVPTALLIAHDLLGSPYSYSGASPGGFDCSGFTQFVFAAASDGSLRLPRTADDQWRQAGAPVARDALQPGDLVFFQQTYAAPAGVATHVGIYIGNGQMINAQNETAGVAVSAITITYWTQHWLGAKRLH